MRYLLILEESQYNDFEKVDGNLLEIYAIDQNGNKRIFDLRPIQREMVVMPNGASVYITQGHIDAMMEYECKQHVKEIYDRMKHNFDDINDLDAFSSATPLLKLDGQDKIQGFVNGISSMEDDENGNGL